MKPFLLLATRADDAPADAEYEAFLTRTGLRERDLCRVRLESEPMPDIDLDAYSGIMVGGSPFNTSTPEDVKSDTQRRVEAEFTALLDRVVAADFPFLGACYGIGTLARHQGAVIDATYAEEVGAPEITLTAAGLADPLCAGITPTFQAFVAPNDAIAHRQAFYADHGYFDPDELPAVQAWTRAQDVSQSWAVLRNFAEHYARD